MPTDAWKADPHFITLELKDVQPTKPYEDPGWTLVTEVGSLFCPNSEGVAEPPKPGERARFYGQGVGYSVRGVVVNDRVYHYLSATDAEAARDAALKQEAAARRRTFDEARAEFDASVAALPEPFRLRITRFLERSAWGPEFGAYELFVCTEAVKIAQTLKSPEAVAEFHTLSNVEQRRRVPDLADSHSGNTFGAACSLARQYLSNPEWVPQHHGALCGLVGCKSYGCWAASMPW
jgi:hypothetical protein